MACGCRGSDGAPSAATRFLMFRVLDPDGRQVVDGSGRAVRFPNAIEARARAADLGPGFSFDSRMVLASDLEQA